MKMLGGEKYLGRIMWTTLVVVATSLLGCGSGPQQQDLKTNLRIINGFSELEAIDVLIDGRVSFEGMGYLESTGYFKIKSGPREIRALAPRTLTTLAESRSSLSDNQDQTFLVYGTRANPRGVLLQDKTDESPRGTVTFRAIRTAQSIPSADLYVLGADQFIDENGPTIRSVGLGSSSTYFRGLPGEYTIWVTESNKKDVVAVARQVVFKERNVYTLLIADAPEGGEPVSVIQLVDRG